MAGPRTLTDGVLAEARRLGFDSVGVCPATPPESLPQYRQWIDRGMHGTMDYLARSLPLRSDPALVLPGVRSIVAVGLNYRQPNPPRPGHPRIAAYALGRDYHKTVRGKLRRLAAYVASVAPGAQSRACVDSAPVLEREFAHKAGLGWYGKNTCLIDSRRGSWFVIGLLLTTAELESSAPSPGGCGTCRLCVEACPTGAIVRKDDLWQIDARSCVSYLTIEHKGAISSDLAAGIGDWTFGCDVCQDVCPFNQQRESQPQRAEETEEPDFRTHRDWPDLDRLAVVEDADWDVLTRGSAVRRARPDQLRRNAKINLANAQEPSQGAQRRKLDRKG